MLLIIQDFVLKLILLIAVADYATSQEPPPLITTCPKLSAGGELRYLTITFQVEGLCDENDIDLCNLENAFRNYFDATFQNNCFPRTVAPNPDADTITFMGYGDVVISNFEVTKKSRKKCQAEITLLTVMSYFISGGTGGGCGNCPPNSPTSYFWGGGGGFRRHLKGRGLMTPKSTKATKATKAAKDNLLDGGPCSDISLLSNFASSGFPVEDMVILDAAFIGDECQTLFACFTFGCTEPGGDVCNRFD